MNWTLNTTAAMPFGATVVIPPGTTYQWTAPAAGCAGNWVGWWTTIDAGPAGPGDDGAAGVREPVRR